MKKLTLSAAGIFAVLNMGLFSVVFAECGCSAGKTNSPANQAAAQAPMNQASVQNFASNAHNTTNQALSKTSADHQTQTNDAATAVKNT